MYEDLGDVSYKIWKYSNLVKSHMILLGPENLFLKFLFLFLGGKTCLNPLQFYTDNIDMSKV